MNDPLHRRRVDPFVPLPLDLSLLQNSPVTLYHLREVLDDDLQKLANCKYRNVIFDCSTWQSEMDLHRAFADQLQFPNYYGHNFDALNDCLGDANIIDQDTAVVLLHFNDFSRENPRAWLVLDIIANASWFHLLFGTRLLGLVQSTDPQISFESVGARPVIWNPREWFDSSRLPR
mgnify:CR=1 FL=1